MEERVLHLNAVLLNSRKIHLQRGGAGNLPVRIVASRKRQPPDLKLTFCVAAMPRGSKFIPSTPALQTTPR